MKYTLLINHEICITNLCFVQSQVKVTIDWYRSKPGSVAQCEFSSKHLEGARTTGVGSVSRVLNSRTFVTQQQRQSVWQQASIAPQLDKLYLPEFVTFPPCSHGCPHKRRFQFQLLKVLSIVQCPIEPSFASSVSFTVFTRNRSLQLKSFELYQQSLLHIRCSRLHLKYILLSSWLNYDLPLEV